MRGFFVAERILLRKLIGIAALAAVFGTLVFWFVTRPNPIAASQIDAFENGDAIDGETVFWAAGCASCHADVKATGEQKKILSGGHAFDTPFGTFYAPNISPHPENGIGAWTAGDFANAMKRGLSPDGEHYYPAFPYTSYAKMENQDVADLWAYMKTLPESDNQAKAHDVGFPFNVRRGLGGWKWLYMSDDLILDVGDDPVLLRGRYLVEALAHCGECHTPRNAIGGPDMSRWMAGGRSPDGKERIPNITPHGDGIGSWSKDDIVNSLETGFTPEFDSFGSSMVDVQLNMAKLPKSDLEAIAAYLKQVEAQPKK